MNKKLEKAVRKQKRQTKQENPPIYGKLGIKIGGAKTVEVPSRNGYVYVRLRNNENEVIQAFNNKVAPAYNLPIIVERQGNRYVVISVDTERYDNNWNSYSPFLPRHGNSHSFNPEGGGAGDIVWVYPRQFMPLLVLPSGSVGANNVLISSYTLRSNDGTWKFIGNTGTPSLTPYNPPMSTGAVIALIYVDANTGNPGLVIGSGSYFSSSITGTNEIVPYIPSVPEPVSQIPLAAIRLVTGTNQISWNNIYDIRQFLHASPSGSAGGSSSITIQDEGVGQGSVTTLNFTGDNISASVAGSVATIFVTGSSGGATNLTGTAVGVPNRVVLTNSSGQIFTSDWLAWGTSSQEYIEFGADVAGKESNAGKMGYEIFAPGYFEIVGAGTDAGDRWVQIYDNLKVGSHLQTNGFQDLGLPSHFMYLNGTGTYVNPINAPERTTITGSFNFFGLDQNNESVRFSLNNLQDQFSLRNGSSTLSGDVQISGSNGVYQEIPGISLSLPVAGTYLIAGTIRAIIQAGVANAFISAKLQNSTDATDVASSETLVILEATSGNHAQNSASMSALVTVNGAKTIKLFAARTVGGVTSFSHISSNSGGRTRLQYVKVG